MSNITLTRLLTNLIKNETPSKALILEIALILTERCKSSIA